MTTPTPEKEAEERLGELGCRFTDNSEERAIINAALATLSTERQAREAAEKEVERLDKAFKRSSMDWLQMVQDLQAKADALVETLERIRDATPNNTNSSSAFSMASWTHAVAAAALSALPPLVPAEEGGELRPCPFCGGEGNMAWYAKGASPACAGYFVECMTCSASGEGFDIQGEMPDREDYTKRKAIAAWNTRPTQAPQDVAGLVEDTWRPISEAPKDGTHILACIAGHSFGWWNGVEAPPVQTVIHWYEFGDESGFYTSVNEQAPDRTFDATHWKPLDGPNKPLRASPISQESKALVLAAADNNHKALVEAEIDEADIPDIVERGRLGAALSVAESAAWSGYEIGWRDGSNDRQEGSR